MRRVEKLYVDLPGLKAGSPGAYLGAAAICVLATWARVAIEPWLAGAQFITFFPAVIITTLLLGARAGLLAVCICTFAAWWFVLPSSGPWRALTPDHAVGLVLFVSVALVDVILIAALRLAIVRYRELSRSLEARVEERTTDLRRTQSELAQAQKMEAVGQLTGGVAHDFNNMLAVVIGSLELAERRLAEGRADVEGQVRNAKEGARRAATLTQRLLAFSRRQPLAPQVVDINKLVSVICELLRRTLGEDVRVECVLGGGLWRASVDPAQLESAIVNLAVNARDAMPNGGTLTVETANAHLDDEYAATHREVRPGQYVLIAVSDTGVGMASEVAARAFEPFFTTKDVGRGTGLGLSQVYGFVKQSGGHVKIYSEPGQGATVRIYLPRWMGSETAPELQAAGEGEGLIQGEGRLVLVVEDEEQVRRVSVEALKELGYRVLEAPNGEQALALLDSMPDVDLLFTDVVMPGMSGRELAERAEALRPGIRVLYTTGYTRNAIVHNGAIDPGVAMLSKPFTLEQLARKVASVFEGGGANRPA